MSEQEPGSAPKPRPPKESYDDILARLETSLAKPAAPAPQVAETPAFNFVDKRNIESQAWSNDTKSEEAQARLDKELAAVESIPVEEAPETPVAAETAVVEGAPAVPDANGVAPEVAATPERAELTHHDYHAQRPAEGSIYRTSKTFRRAPGGSEPAGRLKKKDGLEKYDKQNGVDDPQAAQDYYHKFMNEDEVEAAPATPERPSYETMDTDQLVFAYAKAEMIGDKFVTDDIRNVYTTAMEEAYTQPGSTISYEEHEEALARFDRLTDAAIEYEKAKDPEHSALVDAAVERANKEPSIGDKLKKFWSKGKETVKKLFRPEYWGERFTAAGNKIGEASTWALNLGVNHETDSDEEKDRKRNRNRVLFVAGGAAVAVAAIAGAYGIGYAVGNAGHHATEAIGGGSGAGGHGAAAGDTLSAHDQAVADALTPKHGGVEGANQISPNVAPTPEAIPAGYTVQPNEGGEQLFASLNIDPAKWYANQEHLRSISEGHMYIMDDGNVGLRPGQLPEAVRNAIEALK